MHHIHTILHPTDFSDSSREAFRLAALLARSQGARLIVLHVKQTLGSLIAFGEFLDKMQPAEYDAKLRHIMSHFRVGDPNVEVIQKVNEGDAVDVILQTASDSAADLIVMGTHGRSGINRFILGSVAEKVLRKAQCPVVTVKTPHEKHAVSPMATTMTAGAFI